MQSESHFDLEIRQPDVETWIEPIIEEFLLLIQSNNDLQEGNEREISNILNLSILEDAHTFVRHDLGIVLRNLPDQQKSVSYVLVGTALVLVYHGMHHLRHRVDKHHDLFLENVSDVRKAPDVAEPKNSEEFLAGQHRVEVSLLCHVLGDDVTAGLPEAQGEKDPDFGDGVFDDEGLVGVDFFAIEQGLVFGGERIRSDLVDFPDHPFDRSYGQDVDVTADHETPQRQDDGHEDSTTYAYDSIGLGFESHVDSSL